MKCTKRVLRATKSGVLLVLVLLIAASFPLSLSVAALEVQQAMRMRKFDANLQEKLAALTSKEWVTVYVWTGAASTEEIDTELQASYGLSLDAYESEEVYESVTLPALAAEAAALARDPQVYAVSGAFAAASASTQAAGEGVANTLPPVLDAQALKTAVPVLERLSDRTLADCAAEGMELAQVYALAKQKEFTACRRESVKTLLHEKYGSLLAELPEGSYTVLAQMDYVGCMLLSATVQTVYQLSELAQVSAVSLYVEEELEPRLSTDNSHQTDMYLLEGQVSYGGTGVKVGVLEVAAIHRDDHQNPVSYTGGCDTSAWMLQGANVSWYYGNLTGLPRDDYSTHTTVVCSILVGQQISTFDGMYVGALPRASVVGYSVRSTDASDNSDFANGLMYLIGQGVDVINISMGSSASFTYSNMDLLVDQAIIQNRVSIVVAAGNRDDDNPEAKISSPAHAYNAIVVGNADSDSGLMSNGSAYDQTACNYETNKPDICASGTSIIVPYQGNSSAYDYWRRTGTSVAAPFVTGAVGQMFAANSFLRNNHVITKALLLAAADGSTSAISGQNNATAADSWGLRAKSGAGFLNAARAVSAAISKSYGGTVVDLKESESLGVLMTFSKPAQLTLSAGQTARFVLCFDRPENSILTSQYTGNLDLNITRNNALVASSASQRHNVEVMECIAPSEGGTYRFQIVLSGYTRMASSSTDYRYMLAYCAFVVL